MTTEPKLELNLGAELGEAPLWDAEHQTLYWVDLTGGTLYRYHPASGRNEAYPIGHWIGTVALRRSGGLLLALDDGFAAYDLDRRELTLLANPEAHLPDNRFNDGKIGPDGRFWAGTMREGERRGDEGSLYYLDHDLTVHKVLDGVGISNGLAWSLDEKTLYFVDTYTYSVQAFDYDAAAGALTNSRRVITVDEELGSPDGMTIDVEGMLWIAHWGGWAVRRWNPHIGALLESIRLPVSQVTACAFGGPDLDTLYITTAAGWLPADQQAAQPLAGGLFSVKPGVRGLLPYQFAG